MGLPVGAFRTRLLLDDFKVDGELYLVADHGGGEFASDTEGGAADGGCGGEAGVRLVIHAGGRRYTRDELHERR